MKIYVCVYNGTVFFASTNYLKAWKKMREKRLENFNEYPDNIKGIGDSKWKKNHELPILKRQNYWESICNYFSIEVFDE